MSKGPKTANSELQKVKRIAQTKLWASINSTQNKHKKIAKTYKNCIKCAKYAKICKHTKKPTKMYKNCVQNKKNGTDDVCSVCMLSVKISLTCYPRGLNLILSLCYALFSAWY